MEGEGRPDPATFYASLSSPGSALNFRCAVAVGRLRRWTGNRVICLWAGTAVAGDGRFQWQRTGLGKHRESGRDARLEQEQRQRVVHEEDITNREAADTKWRAGSQGRGPRGGRGNYTSGYSSHDAGAGRNVAAIKENGIVLDTDKENSSSSLASQDMDYKAASAENNPLGSTSRSMTNLSNGPSKEVHLSAQQPSLNGITLVEQLASTVKNGGISSAKEEESSSFGEGSSSAVVVSAGVYASTSDPILLASCDGYLAASVGAIKREVGFQPSAVDKNADNAISYEASDSDLSLSNEVGAQEKDHPFSSGKIQGNSIEVGGTQVPSVLLSTASTAAVGVSGSRQSSNYGVRSQYPSGHLKAVQAKEWKPKSANVLPAPNSEVVSNSDGDLNKERAVEAVPSFFHVSESMVSDLSTKTLKIKDLNISDAQHVIIPDHLQVPESEITGLSFGSFGSNFEFAVGSKVEPEIIQNPDEPSDSSVDVEDNIDQLPLSTSGESPAAQDNNYADDQQADAPDDHSSNVADIPSDISPATDYVKAKPVVTLAAEGPHQSVIHAAPAYSNFGLVPQMLGSPFAPFESQDIQTRDTARLPGFVVPQPFDPSSNYYASVFRPSADGDGRFSPFLAPGAAPKYNGSISVLPPQTVPSSQESEGSAIWISPPGRDIPTLQASSFYNVPPHGQPVAFAPAQAVHTAAFAGVYHPTQSVATGTVHPLLQQSQPTGISPEVVGPPAGVYQQPQRASPINWVNNF
ncbi:hypothetical protein HPP92_019221 [Vanilla planifolia]|uniref:GBF-interacting protein 1 N-terminal domain-containing protein n=1 Tax=Vanilla planifolia TaxID=51239 RepID=A0A835QC28_VANPL|nr:hypothetical protein HPP92_019221 [Vanilla planifolia]